MSSPVRALIFDLDGTLADTIEDIGVAMNAELTSRGLRTYGFDEYRAFIGRGARLLVEHVLEDAHRALADEVLKAFRARYMEHLVVRTRPYDGMSATLDALAARGVPCAVLSNKPHAMTTRIVATLFPRIAFTGVLGKQDGIPHKPDPTSALLLAEGLRTPVASIAFLGDSDADVGAAKAAGMRPIGVAWGYRTREHLREAGAERILEHPSEALGLIG